ncbi:MAG: carboxypeptidase-like regulatory domain-containing protein [Gemmataceae bacterium]|nr:carboxypeptidase-like regulatory domain-containing protein [Gemmataceae bacterium]
MMHGSHSPLAAPFAPRPPRPLAVFGSVVLLAFVFVALGGMLAFVGPSEDPLFVPFWIADADSIARTEISQAFPRANPNPTISDRAALIRRLDDLRSASVSEALVVYLHAPATLNDEGKLCLLPADAVADQPQTWLPLQEVLTRLKRSAARNQLLLVELALPTGKLASLTFDPSAFLERELETIPDPRRTVLFAEQATRTSLAQDRLGRSPFALTVERALAGMADGCVDGRKDGRVGVQEFTAFVRANTSRIADEYGLAGNVRLHGENRDFTLTSLSSRGVATMTMPTSGDYPARLRERWQEAGELLKRTDRDPRRLQSLRHTLGDMEAKWRRQPKAKLDETEVAAIEKSLAALRDDEPPSVPLVFSQAQESAVDAQAVLTIREGMTGAYRDLSGVAPAEMAKAYSRWLDTLAEKWRAIPVAIREAGIFAWAIQDTRHNAEAIRFADFVGRKLVAEEPRTPESLALRQLADLASRGIEPWPAELAGHWLRATRNAEQFAASLESADALRSRWIEAEESRRRTEVRLLAYDFVSPIEALKLAAEADRHFESLMWDSNILRNAWGRLNEARRLLTTLESAADRHAAWHSPWLDLAEKTYGLLRVLPECGGREMAAIDAETAELTRALGEVDRLRARELALLAKKQADGAFDADCWRSGDALLCGDLLSADERASLLLSLPRQDAGGIAKRLRADFQELAAVAPEVAGLNDAERRRIERKMAWSRLAGLSPDALTLARAKLVRLKDEPTDIAALQDLLRVMRQVEQVDLPTRFAAAKSPAQRERLAWALPDAADSPWLERRQDAIRTWQMVQTDRFRSRVRDLRGLGIESPAAALCQRFAARIADALGGEGGADDGSVLVKSEPMDRSLYAGHLQSTMGIEIQPVVDGLAKTAIETTASADPNWLSVSPNRIELNELRRPEDPPFKATLQVRLRPEAETKPHAAPRGFLLQSVHRGVAYHRAIEVPLEAAAQSVKILVSDNPKEPSSLAEEIRLRPGKIRQSFFVYLKNMEDKKRPIRVEFAANDHGIAGSMQDLVLEPREVRKAPFMAEGELADFQGPLSIRVIDPEKNARIAWRQVRVAVASPRDYVRIASLRSIPNGDGAGLEVKLLPKDVQSSLPIEAELHAGDVVTASTKIPLPLKAKHLAKSGIDLPVYVSVDGVPRSFIVQAGYAESPQPRTDDRIAVRLKAPSISQPQANERITIEVDNAPAAANLELSLVRPGSGTPQFELVRRFNGPRQNLVRVRAGADGALVFDAAIEDWTVTLDTTPFQGPRILKARLLDELGRELQQTVHEWMFDRTPPNDVRFLDLPKQAKRGTMLSLQLAAGDAESDIAQVIVFRGRPVQNAIPPGTETFAAQPLQGTPGMWAVQASLSPEARGPTAITVKATNRAGLSRYETSIVEALDVDPETLRVGKIAGHVFEGMRPQPNLLVILKDIAGKEAARVQTRPDGAFLFEGVQPGSYRIEVAKPESGRRANGPVLVPPNGLGKCDLHLSL